jgi:hypothetical protein
MPLEGFRYFLDGLSPHSFCVPCLARMYEQPERVIRQAIQPLMGRLESRMGACRGCEEPSQIYRIR